MPTEYCPICGGVAESLPIMPTEYCPICGGVAESLPRTGDADKFDCPIHGKVKVAGTVLATRSSATRQEWEKAFDRAKARAEPGDCPLIMDGDF